MGELRSPLCSLLQRLVLGTVALLILLVPAMAQAGGQELEGKPVVKIELRGLRGLDPPAVKALMQTKEGKPFRAELLDEDIITLMDRNVFEIIPWVWGELTTDGLGVRVVLNAEQVSPRALSVVFLGIIAFNRDDLLPLIRTAAGRQVNDFTLRLDQEELLKHYKKEGYQQFLALF